MMGDLRKLATVGAIEPDRGRGGSPKLEKTAASELARSGEDGGGGEETKKTAAAGARIRRSSDDP